MEINKCLLGDCLELMNNIDDKSIDMVLCDLPYNVTVCKWDILIPFEDLWEQYKRIIKDNGAIVLFGSEPFSSKLRLSNLAWYKYDWKWEKSRPTGHLQAKKQPLKNIEDIIVFYNKQPKYNPQNVTKVNITHKNTEKRINSSGMGKVANAKKEYKQTISNYPRRILKFNNEHNVGELVHPTQKPIELLKYLIKTYTDENELVLDNTAGTFSTAIACLETNRNYIIMEKEEEYYNKGIQRIKEWKEK